MFACVGYLPRHEADKEEEIRIEVERQLAFLEKETGVRMDGTNATIIGKNPGEFVADRNNITRTWMDHGAWPFLTILLYIDQTGDFDLLLQKQTYFKDPQLSRTMEKDLGWMSQFVTSLRGAAMAAILIGMPLVLPANGAEHSGKS